MLFNTRKLSVKNLQHYLLGSHNLSPAQICLLETDLEVLLDDINEYGPDNVRIKVTLEILARKVKIYKAQNTKMEHKVEN